MAVAKKILNGYYMTRDRAVIPYSITGLIGSDEARAIQIFKADGLPQINLQNRNAPGIPHPLRPELICTDLQIVEVHGLDTAVVHAIYTYRPDQETGTGGDIEHLSFTTQAIQVETEFDHTGYPISVKYDYGSTSSADPGDCDGDGTIVLPATPENGTSTAVKIQCQVGKVTKYVPVGILRIRRRENKFPLKLAMDIAGKVNINPWMKENAEAWICMGANILATDDTGGKSLVEWEFHLNQEGWQKTAAFIIPETGRPPVVTNIPFERRGSRPAIYEIANRSFRNGYTLVRCQGLYAFELLNLPDFSGNIV